MPVALLVLTLLIVPPRLLSELLELMVTAGSEALRSTWPPDSMVILPALDVVWADLLSVLMSVSARAAV